MTDQKPKPLDLSHHLTAVAKARVPSFVKAFYKYFGQPGVINLAAGMPYNEYFPIDTIDAAIATPNRFTDSSHSQLLALIRGDDSTSHMDIPKHVPANTKPTEKIDTATYLQYSTAEGSLPLRTFIKDFSLNFQHQGLIPYDSPEVILTCGNTDGFYKASQLVLDGHRGDKMLVEQFSYMTAVQSVVPFGIEVVPVTVDSEGINTNGAGSIADVLENWDNLRRGTRPSVLYTVPTGQNPTGGTLSLERRKEVYAVCQKYDVIIIEDDPYWYLQYSNSGKGLSGREFMSSLVPSYITIDIDGRVMRLDTFSKTAAPGTRLGWITTTPFFCERLLRVAECSTGAPSGVTQAMMAELLLNNWKMDGWISWLSRLRDKYFDRMEIMVEELTKRTHMKVVEESPAEKASRCDNCLASAMAASNLRDQTTAALPIIENDYSLLTTVDKELYSFSKPMGGMFVWVHVNITSHPRYTKSNLKELMEELWDFLASGEYKVLSCPGWLFAPTHDIAEGISQEFFRLSFTAISVEEVREACKRFGVAMKVFFLDDRSKPEESL